MICGVLVPQGCGRRGMAAPPHQFGGAGPGSCRQGEPSVSKIAANVRSTGRRQSFGSLHISHMQGPAGASFNSFVTLNPWRA